jgi:hypothetical protein
MGKIKSPGLGAAKRAPRKPGEDLASALVRLQNQKRGVKRMQGKGGNFAEFIEMAVSPRELRIITALKGKDGS